MRRISLLWAAGLAGVLLAAGPARAWHGKGHHVATELAVQAGGDRLPEFFRAGKGQVAHCSLDPDLFTRPIAGEPLHGAEAPEHFFDLELLGGADVPAGRYEFLTLCARKGLQPHRVGLLPYAVAEWTQRLTVAFAEHRAYHDDPHVRSKCLTYAGLLSHYAQDLCQPLHVTIHWDGRAKPDGSSPRSGIHTKVDALWGKLRVDRAALLKEVKFSALGELLPEVLAEVRRSHALVERVYELEGELPGLEEPLKPLSPAAAFAAERLRAAVRFTASLYVKAWQDSEKTKLPSWYRRPYFPPDEE